MDAENEGMLNEVMHVTFPAQHLACNRDQAQPSGKDLHQRLGNASPDKQTNGCHFTSAQAVGGARATTKPTEKLILEPPNSSSELTAY